MWMLIEIVYGVYCCMVEFGQKFIVDQIAIISSDSNSNNENKNINTFKLWVLKYTTLKWFYVNWNSNNNQFSGVKPFPCWPFEFWWLFVDYIDGNKKQTTTLFITMGTMGGWLLDLARPFLFLSWCAIMWINTPIFLLLFFYNNDKQWTNAQLLMLFLCARTHTQKSFILNCILNGKCFSQ